MHAWEGRERGKEGSGKYTLPWALEFDLHLPQVAMVSRLRNTIMNIDKQADVDDLITEILQCSCCSINERH